MIPPLVLYPLFRARLFQIFSKKNLFFPLKKSLFSFLSVCLGFLEKTFYQKNLF